MRMWKSSRLTNSGRRREREKNIQEAKWNDKIQFSAGIEVIVIRYIFFRHIANHSASLPYVAAIYL